MGIIIFQQVDTNVQETELSQGRIMSTSDTFQRRVEINQNQVQKAVQLVKQNDELSKPIMLLQWDDISQTLKFAIDVIKYVIEFVHQQKKLFRTYPSQYFVYVHNRQKQGSNYFHQKDDYKDHDNQLYPSIDLTLQRGLWIWSEPIYSQHLNLITYQLQCVLSPTSQMYSQRLIRYDILNIDESQTKIKDTSFLDQADLRLLQIAHIISSHIIFVYENEQSHDLQEKIYLLKNQIDVKDDDSFIVADEFLNSHQDSSNVSPQKAVILQIITKNGGVLPPNKNFWKDYYKDITILQVQESNRSNDTMEEVLDIKKDILSTVHNHLSYERGIKQINLVDIDFYVQISTIQYLSQFKDISDLLIQEEIEEIYNKAFDKQLQLMYNNCYNNYENTLRSFCSSNQFPSIHEIMLFLNNLRLITISKFRFQMISYESTRSCKKYLELLKKVISQLEQESIIFFQDIEQKDHEQQLSLLKSKNLNLRVGSEKHYIDHFDSRIQSFLNDYLKYKSNSYLKQDAIVGFLLNQYPIYLTSFTQKFDKQTKKQSEQEQETDQAHLCRILVEREKLGKQKIKRLEQYQSIMKQEDKIIQQQLEVNTFLHHIQVKIHLRTRQNLERMMQENLAYEYRLYENDNLIFRLKLQNEKLKKSVRMFRVKTINK